MRYPSVSPIGSWISDKANISMAASPADQGWMLRSILKPVFAVGAVSQDGAANGCQVAATSSCDDNAGTSSIVLVNGGSATIGTSASNTAQANNVVAGQTLPLYAYVPALRPEQLGDRSFCARHGIRYAYVSGSMANGIASTELVMSMAQHGCLGFYGSAGLSPDRVEGAIVQLQEKLGQLPFGCNLINSPNDPNLERAIADIFIRTKVRRIEASAYLTLTLPLLRYRFQGIGLDPQGNIVVPNQVVAKVSRLEVATKFLSPAPDKLIRALVSEGSLTAEQAELAARVPVASDVTAEADSGGHTDNRPAISLIPSVIDLRDKLAERYGYYVPVGAAGGISTPASTAAAFAMGAAYVMTGSVNQACQESGSCDWVREVLAKAGPADVAMAPAADMFEMGVNVQVLKFGTLFPVRARKLYELYRQYNSFTDIPATTQATIERDCLRTSFAQAWESTRDFFQVRDPRQIARAEQDPKHKMALVFRSYLGQASRWANCDEVQRRADFQIWCGPAMGAFNAWTQGSFLAIPHERKAHVVAQNLLVGACVVTRANSLRQQGVALSPQACNFVPHTYKQLNELLQESTDAI